MKKNYTTQNSYSFSDDYDTVTLDGSSDINLTIDADHYNNYNFDDFTITGSTSSYTIDTVTGWNTTPGIQVTQGNIQVNHDGDIKLGDRSLKEFIDDVEKRLNILRPSLELEEKWDELRKLGEQYRELEKNILQQQELMKVIKES